MVRRALESALGKLQARREVFAVVVHPDERRQKQWPETLRLYRCRVERGEVKVAVVGLEGDPAEALVDVVGVNGKEGTGLQVLGIFESLGGGARRHGALHGMSRFALHVAHLELAERIPQVFGLALFEQRACLQKSRRVAQVVVAADAHDVFEHASGTFVFVPQLLGEGERLVVAQRHRRGRRPRPGFRLFLGERKRGGFCGKRKGHKAGENCRCKKTHGFKFRKFSSCWARFYVDKLWIELVNPQLVNKNLSILDDWKGVFRGIF